MWKFTFLGEPCAKAAVHHALIKGNVIGFKDKKTRAAMGDIRSQLQAQLPPDWKAITGACSVKFRFYRARPKSAPKKLVYPISRPDLSNYIKLIEDALNGIVFDDDARIVRMEASKEFGEPRTEMEVEVI